MSSSRQIIKQFSKLFAMVVFWNWNVIQVWSLYVWEVSVLDFEALVFGCAFIWITDDELIEHCDECLVVVGLAYETVHERR